MRVYPQRKGRFTRRASVMVQGVIFGGTVGVSVAALAVDTGLMFAAKQELQSAADAAALAAASQLGAGDASNLAVQEGASFAAKNNVTHQAAQLMETDVEFGHAVLTDNGKFDFVPGQQPHDAVRVMLRREAGVGDGPVSLLFAKTFGVEGADLHASATAMLVPRDISVVIDLSGSMNDDSELRHYTDFPSETGGTREGVQINLHDVWLGLPIEKGNAGVGNGLDPPPPGNPNNENDQPGTGPGSPDNAGGNPAPGAEPIGGQSGGPRWGWMTAFGEQVTLDSYSPTSDSGLYYIPRYSTCTDADVIENLIQASYSSAERAALLSGQYDSSSTYYRNRVRVLLGLAGWRSKKQDGKYNGGPGNGDNRVDSNELWQEIDWPFDGGSWNNYINYVKSSSTQMYRTDSNFRYRYGIKTVVNYLLETQANHSAAPELADVPEEPLFSVKDSVQVMIDEIIALETQDHVSLEAFAQYGYHLRDLTVPDLGEDLYDLLQQIPQILNGHQAGHYTSITNIGAGLNQAYEELTSDRARGGAAKVVILLTDGKPNTNQWNNHVGNDHPEAIGWALDRADTAKEEGMTIYVVGVGGDVNEELLKDIATGDPDVDGNLPTYFFADNTPDPDNGGLPKYVTELGEIFQTLGGKRPVRLIQ